MVDHSKQKIKLLWNCLLTESTRYSVEPRTRKYVKGYGFLPFGRRYTKKLLDTWIDAVTTASKFCQKREEILNELIQVL